MLKVLTGCTGPNLKDSILRRNLIQTNYYGSGLSMDTRDLHVHVSRAKRTRCYAMLYRTSCHRGIMLKAISIPENIFGPYWAYSEIQ